MSALPDFLLARIAEDEAAARYATTRDPVNDSEWSGWWLGHYQHYSRHDPERVLARCEADRHIVEEMTFYAGNEGKTGVAVADTVLGLLALAYADHPEYDKGWRP